MSQGEKIFRLISIYMCLFIGSISIGAPQVAQVNKSAADTLDFRSKRKVGVGVGVAGAYGMVGTSFELNFSPNFSLATQFGLSSNYNSFGLSFKSLIGGRWFAPYISGGFTRWYTVNPKGPINSTNPGFLGEKFLSKSEIRQGEFAKTFVYPALGVQYMQLSGDWAGTSLFAEVLMLVDISQFNSAPTASMGVFYYF